MSKVVFKKSIIRVSVPSQRGLELKSVSEEDLENLRIWKNKNKEFFFHKEDITTSQQKLWYESFIQRPYDLLFMTVLDGKTFGCMGIRLLDGYWDVYNVILGIPLFSKQGLMGKAFFELLCYSMWVKRFPITLHVLKRNPAVGWYQKQGFSILEEHSDYFVMKFELD
jgi:ribosomal protein S18 acetylase RimI-like enzyme